MTLQEIENKKEELNQIKAQYEKDIEEMKWKYIKETFGIEKGNILEYKGKYGVLEKITYLTNIQTWFKCRMIKKDTTIGEKVSEILLRESSKVFNSYEEYKQSLENL